MSADLANCAANLATALKRYNALVEYQDHAQRVDELSAKMVQSADAVEKLRGDLKEAVDIQQTIQADLDEADRIASHKYAGIKSVEDAKAQAERERANITKLMTGLNNDYMRIMLPHLTADDANDNNYIPTKTTPFVMGTCNHVATCEEINCPNAKEAAAPQMINIKSLINSSNKQVIGHAYSRDIATALKSGNPVDIADAVRANNAPAAAAANPPATPHSAAGRPYAVTSSMFSDNVDMDAVKANLNSAQAYFAKKQDTGNNAADAETGATSGFVVVDSRNDVVGAARFTTRCPCCTHH